MDRSAIAQIVIKRVFGMRKWYVAASLDLELAIAVMVISLVTLWDWCMVWGGKGGGLADFLAAEMVSCNASGSTG